MKKIEDIFTGKIIPNMENVYNGINNKSRQDDAIISLNEIELLIQSFKEEVRKEKVDPVLSKNALLQCSKAEGIFIKIRGYLQDYSKGDAPESYKPQIEKYVSSLHLILNGLKDIAREIDRKYVKKPDPNWLKGPGSCTGCSDSCNTDIEEKQ